ncbi:hypothetical protein HPB49_006090 [Dermacentor silvarum]|uniref:Uncharacterized protein n=1 Tax=Dermacentor silvarum TaxID=543639 RepID=A0ACB8D376_DERSI|nr:hypothetical protein HPB49_006090 [Dermacentor silvarum]
MMRTVFMCKQDVVVEGSTKTVAVVQAVDTNAVAEAIVASAVAKASNTVAVDWGGVIGSEGWCSVCDSGDSWGVVEGGSGNSWGGMNGSESWGSVGDGGHSWGRSQNRGRLEHLGDSWSGESCNRWSRLEGGEAGHSWSSGHRCNSWGGGDNWGGLVGGHAGHSWGSGNGGNWSGGIGSDSWCRVDSSDSWGSVNGGQCWSSMVGRDGSSKSWGGNGVAGGWSISKAMADTEAGEARIADSVAKPVAGQADTVAEIVTTMQETSKGAG